MNHKVINCDNLKQDRLRLVKKGSKGKVLTLNVTYADTTPLEEDFGYKPSTPLRDGLRNFAEWYKEFYF